MAKRKAGQQTLDGLAGRRSQGTVERHASNDLRLLRALEVMPPGTDSLQSTYRLLAQEFDAAHREHDRYGKINTARELLRIREALSPIAIAAGGMTIEEILSALPVDS